MEGRKRVKHRSEHEKADRGQRGSVHQRKQGDIVVLDGTLRLLELLHSHVSVDHLWIKASEQTD
jgi:hypothetical protein